MEYIWNFWKSIFAFWELYEQECGEKIKIFLERQNLRDLPKQTLAKGMSKDYRINQKKRIILQKIHTQDCYTSPRCSPKAQQMADHSSQCPTESLIREFKSFLSCWKAGEKMDHTHKFFKHLEKCYWHDFPSITNYFLYVNVGVLSPFWSLELH